MRVTPGKPRPLGATPDATGVQFAVFSRHATAVTVCLFDEAARLLATDTGEIQTARFEAVQQLQHRYGGAAVLKGAGSLVCGGPDEPLGLCTDGNPGMASGGMGDVLSGIMGGLLAQGLDVSTAARVGTLVHALAADRAVEHEGERGLVATDLLPQIRRLVNGGAGAL